MQGSTHIKALKAQIADAERKTEKLLDKIVATDDPALSARLEEKFNAQELSKTVLKEKRAQAGQPARPFWETLEHAIAFLASRWKIWEKTPTLPAEPS